MTPGQENMFSFLIWLGNVADWCWEHWYIAVLVIIIFSILVNSGERIVRQQDIEKGVRNSKKKDDINNDT